MRVLVGLGRSTLNPHQSLGPCTHMLCSASPLRCMLHVVGCNCNRWHRQQGCTGWLATRLLPDLACVYCRCICQGPGDEGILPCIPLCHVCKPASLLLPSSASRVVPLLSCSAHHSLLPGLPTSCSPSTAACPRCTGTAQPHCSTSPRASTYPSHSSSSSMLLASAPHPPIPLQLTQCCPLSRAAKQGWVPRRRQRWAVL